MINKKIPDTITADLGLGQKVFRIFTWISWDFLTEAVREQDNLTYL